MEVRRRQPLVKRGIVSEADIENALEYQREHPSKKIGDILHILDACEPTMLIEAIGEVLGLKGIVLNSNTIKINLTEYISLDIAKKNKAIPFEISNGKIKVCFADTSTNKSIDAIRLRFLNKGLVMESYITFESDIDKILKNLEGEATTNLSTTAKNENTVNLVDSIIKTGIDRRASDIHIEPMAEEIRVRYRIDGELFTAASISKSKKD